MPENNNFAVPSIDSDYFNKLVDEAKDTAAKNEDITHLREIMETESENKEDTSATVTYAVGPNGKPDFSSPVANNGELKEADLALDEIDKLNEVNEQNLTDSVVNGDTAKMFELTDEEAENVAKILILYRNNKKMNVYREMIPSMKARVTSLCLQSGIPLDQAGNVARYMMDQFLSTASADEEFIDIEKTIERTMKIPSMIDLYMEHINDTMDVKLPAMAEAMKETEPEKAAKLLEIRDQYNAAFLFSRLREMYDTNSRLRKACRRDFSDAAVNKAANNTNYFNSKTNFKMPDCTNIPGIIRNVMFEKGYDTRNDVQVQAAINKFCILLFESASYLKLDELNDAAFYYYMIKNISMMAYLGDKKSDFSAELISNINITMHYISLREAEFYEQNGNKRPEKCKRSVRNRMHG